MDKKLHIKAIARGNVKIDAFWYKYGDDIDCYITPAHFKSCINGNAFLDFDIIMDDDDSQTIKPEYKIVEGVVADDTEIRKSANNEKQTNRKSTKKN